MVIITYEGTNYWAMKEALNRWLMFHDMSPVYFWGIEEALDANHHRTWRMILHG